jgi:hypothetical protein
MSVYTYRKSGPRVHSQRPLSSSRRRLAVLKASTNWWRITTALSKLSCASKC